MLSDYSKWNGSRKAVPRLNPCSNGICSLTDLDEKRTNSDIEES